MDSTDRNWLVTVVDTGQKGLFKPGDLIIIGRTPQHLPTPGSSFKRFNIDNPQKSMSKRHLSLQVGEGGDATIKDLGSTNGTYLVKKSGALVKLPAGQDFILDKSPVRLQLGNIGIVLEKTDGSAQKEEPAENGDLFSHSSSGPSAARSVKDIREAMEEREEEPTFFIDADRVAEKVKEKQEKAEAGSEKEEDKASEEGEKPQEDLGAREEASPESEADSAKMQEENREKAKLVDKAIEERLKKESPAVSVPSATVPLPSAAAAGGQSSLFERLTRGGRRQENIVRLANGMTSEDAEKTDSFAKQFELAKHREMLPFLALNPYLYSDLYTWLEALGDPVINAALQTNRGYQTFKSEGGND